MRVLAVKSAVDGGAGVVLRDKVGVVVPFLLGLAMRSNAGSNRFAAIYRSLARDIRESGGLQNGAKPTRPAPFGQSAPRLTGGSGSPRCGWMFGVFPCRRRGRLHQQPTADRTVCAGMGFARAQQFLQSSRVSASAAAGQSPSAVAGWFPPYRQRRSKEPPLLDLYGSLLFPTLSRRVTPAFAVGAQRFRIRQISLIPEGIKNRIPHCVYACSNTVKAK